MERSTRRTALRARTLGAAIVLGAALALTGCGMDAQTLQPYTPAQGVNADDGGIKVRNLLVVADGHGNGLLSGALTATKADSLVKVSGTALKPNGSDAGALTFTGGPVAVNASLAVLSSSATPFRTNAATLVPGLTARLSLTYASGAQTTLVVPVVSSSNPIYTPLASAVTPSPTPSAPAAETTPSASTTP